VEVLRNPLLVEGKVGEDPGVVLKARAWTMAAWISGWADSMSANGSECPAAKMFSSMA